MSEVKLTVIKAESPYCAFGFPAFDVGHPVKDANAYLDEWRPFLHDAPIPQSFLGDAILVTLNELLRC